MQTFPHDVGYILSYIQVVFDTTDHSILLSRLNTSFDLSGSLLSWFHSYLSSRTYFPSVASQLSSSLMSLKGQLFLFCIFNFSLLLSVTILFHYSFSDDYQLYASAHLSELHEMISSPRLAFSMSRPGCITTNCS